MVEVGIRRYGNSRTHWRWIDSQDDLLREIQKVSKGEASVVIRKAYTEDNLILAPSDVETAVRIRHSDALANWIAG